MPRHSPADSPNMQRGAERIASNLHVKLFSIADNPDHHANPAVQVRSQRMWTLAQGALDVIIGVNGEFGDPIDVENLLSPDADSMRVSLSRRLATHTMRVIYHAQPDFSGEDTVWHMRRRQIDASSLEYTTPQIDPTAEQEGMQIVEAFLGDVEAGHPTDIPSVLTRGVTVTGQFEEDFVGALIQSDGEYVTQIAKSQSRFTPGYRFMATLSRLSKGGLKDYTYLSTSPNKQVPTPQRLEAAQLHGYRILEQAGLM